MIVLLLKVCQFHGGNQRQPTNFQAKYANYDQRPQRYKGKGNFQFEYCLHYSNIIKISKLTSSFNNKFIDGRVPIPKRLHRLFQRIFLKVRVIEHDTWYLMRLGVFVLIDFPPGCSDADVPLRGQLRDLNGGLTAQVAPEAFDGRTAALGAAALVGVRLLPAFALADDGEEGPLLGCGGVVQFSWGVAAGGQEGFDFRVRNIDPVETVQLQQGNVTIFQNYYHFMSNGMTGLYPKRQWGCYPRVSFWGGHANLVCLCWFDNFIMSFQGIRRIRQARRQSPALFESYEMGKNYAIKPLQLNFDLKSSNPSKDGRTTRDSEVFMEGAARHSRKGSLSGSSQKDKNSLFCNFLHINLDAIKPLKPSRELKADPSKTERTVSNRSSVEDYQNTPIQRLSLSSFSLEFVVGKGGFGKVWKVGEKCSGKTFAMKEMQKVKIISKRSVHSVMNEQALLQKLKNPFLVNMAYSFQDRENLFLVMDYCNRGDLRYHLGTRRKFKEEESRFFLGCIVLALQYMHSRRVIHRDLKPENLVLDDRGYLRVTDLGVSRETKPNNAEDTSGTPGYMAPEVICKTNHSFPVDFFALGVIAFEFMTGRRPYVGANRKEIREKMLAKQVQLDEIPPYGWSRESVDFINRLIQRRPEERLGFKGIEEVKYHPFFKKMDWQKLEMRKIHAPFLPDTIEDDYANYKECISEDTEIQDMEEYQLILRHKDTQQAFVGYDFNLTKKPVRKEDLVLHTTRTLRKRNSLT